MVTKYYAHLYSDQIGIRHPIELKQCIVCFGEQFFERHALWADGSVIAQHRLNLCRMKTFLCVCLSVRNACDHTIGALDSRCCSVGKLMASSLWTRILFGGL
jgi:hypothetical protein